METTINHELKKLLDLELNKGEVLESYKHITLTEDEMIDALIAAKIKKEKMLQYKALEEKANYNRMLSSKKFDHLTIKTFMMTRAKDIFKYEFILDDDNTDVFDLLCCYFVGDEERFKKIASLLSVDNPSLSKGILLCGNFGTGKTDIMKLFAKNNRQVYYMRMSKDICSAFLRSKDKSIPEDYLEPFKLAINDTATFCQPLAGMCIDEIGAESVKNSFGNVSNVIGDLIEARYNSGYTGLFLHGTTNLSAKELNDFYGERVTSRMRQIFNFIELPGNDRRK